MLLSLCQASLADGEHNRHRLYEMTSVLWDAMKADIALCVCVCTVYVSLGAYKNIDKNLIILHIRVSDGVSVCCCLMLQKDL